MALIRQAQPGFTLMEILIAIAIVAIMGVVVVPSLFKYRSEAQITAAKTTLKNLKLAVESFNTDIGSYPETLQDLIRKPLNEELAKDWRAAYLDSKNIPKDPWNLPFQYNVTPGGAHEYELYSYGPKKKSAPQAEWLSVWDL